MVSLVFTDRAKVAPDHLGQWDDVVGKNGVPQVFDLDMAWLREPSLYLWQKAGEPGFSSPNTWRTAATHLKEVLGFFEEQGWDWRTADRAHFRVYHDRIRKPRSGVTPISRSTWNQRIGHWKRFLQWAHEEGFIDRVPIKKTQFTGLRGRQRAQDGITEPGRDVTIRALPAASYRTFAAGIIERRDRLLADTMVVTGMRIAEVHALTVASLPDPTRPENRDLRYLSQVITGKGRNQRTIEWPATLLARIRRYCREERADVVDACAQRPSYSDPGALWLSKRGGPLSKSHTQSLFRKTSKLSGVRATPHTLRHTYATRLLSHLIRAEAVNQDAVRARGGRPSVGDMVMNPLQFVQRRLGHARIETTFLYLDIIADADPAVISAADNFTDEFLP